MLLDAGLDIQKMCAVVTRVTFNPGGIKRIRVISVTATHIGRVMKVIEQLATRIEEELAQPARAGTRALELVRRAGVRLPCLADGSHVVAIPRGEDSPELREALRTLGYGSMPVVLIPPEQRRAPLAELTASLPRSLSELDGYPTRLRNRDEQQRVLRLD